MKKYLLLFSALLFITAVAAQETQTFIKAGQGLDLSRWGFAFTAYGQQSNWDRESAYNLGLRAGVVWNDRLALGGFYQQNINEVRLDSFSLPDNSYLDMKLGGGYLEYTLWADRLVHLSLPLMIGGGELQADYRDEYDWSDDGKDYFGVVDPLIIESPQSSTIYLFSLKTNPYETFLHSVNLSARC